MLHHVFLSNDVLKCTVIQGVLRYDEQGKTRQEVITHIAEKNMEG